MNELYEQPGVFSKFRQNTPRRPGKGNQRERGPDRHEMCNGHKDALIGPRFRSRNRAAWNKVERNSQVYHGSEKDRLRSKAPPKKKSKRKSIFKTNPGRSWNRQDAEKALLVELQARKKQGQTLILRFPDPEISVDMIKGLHRKIEKVHVQVPLQPRYCFIKVSEDANLEEVIGELENSDFNALGRIKVERKSEKPEESLAPEMIDPYTLYLGNLPLTITADEIKQKFTSASRVDIGFSCRMGFTRYAFLRYQTVEESIDAFQSSHDTVLHGRSVIVRFRRIQRDAIPSESTPSQEKGRKCREMQKYSEQNTTQMESNLNLDNILGGFNFCENDDQVSEEADEEEEDDDEDEDDD